MPWSRYGDEDFCEKVQAAKLITPATMAMMCYGGNIFATSFRASALRQWRVWEERDSEETRKVIGSHEN